MAIAVTQVRRFGDGNPPNHFIESLVLALYLPMFRNQPWFCKGTIYLETFRKQVRTLFLDNRNATKVFKLMLKNKGFLSTATATDATELLNFVGLTGTSLEAFWFWQGPCFERNRRNNCFDGIFC